MQKVKKCSEFRVKALRDIETMRLHLIILNLCFVYLFINKTNKNEKNTIITELPLYQTACTYRGHTTTFEAGRIELKSCHIQKNFGKV